MKAIIFGHNLEIGYVIRQYYSKHEEDLGQIAPHGIETTRACHSVEN